MERQLPVHDSMETSDLFQLLTSLLPGDVATGLCAGLQERSGADLAHELATSRWFVDLENWRDFAREARAVLQGVESEVAMPFLVDSHAKRIRHLSNVPQHEQST